MLKYLLDRPILTLCVKDVEYFPRLAQAMLEFDYKRGRAERLFSRRDLEGLSPETRENLADLTGEDVYHGHYWQIADDPQEVGFYFFSIPQQCLYLTNVPYLVIHHSPTGFAWGYSGSGPSDLGLNVGEYFCRKLGWTEPSVKLWRRQTASAAAYAAHFEIRNWLNQTLSTNRYRIQYQAVEQAITQILFDTPRCKSLA